MFFYLYNLCCLRSKPEPEQDELEKLTRKDYINYNNHSSKYIYYPLSSKKFSLCTKQDIAAIKNTSDKKFEELDKNKIHALYEEKESAIKNLRYYNLIIQQFADLKVKISEVEQERELLQALDFYQEISNKYGQEYSLHIQSFEIERGGFVCTPSQDKQKFYSANFEVSKQREKLLFK